MDLAGLDILAEQLVCRWIFEAKGGTERRVQIRVEDQGHSNREADVLQAAHCQSDQYGHNIATIEELTSSVAARRRLSYHAHRVVSE